MKIDDAAIAKEIAQYFNTNFPAEQFNTSFGWTVIKTFFTSENDRYAQYFVSNRKQLEAIAGKPAIDSFETRMQTTILNRLLQASDEKAFFEKLTYFSQSSDIEKRRSAIVFEADWYNKKRDVEKFNKLMENARNGILKNDADRLAAVARKADYRGLGDPAFRPMCYKLAKQALLLKPDDYGTISTFAYVCLSNKKKEEGLVAAKKAKSIAYTTKVEATMQKVIDELEQL